MIDLVVTWWIAVEDTRVANLTREDIQIIFY